MSNTAMIPLRQDEYEVREPDKRWLKCSICLTVVVVLLVVLSITLLSLTIVYWKRASKSSKICISKDCIITASTFIEAMEPTVDPCVDFYQFSCGGYMRKHPVPDDVYSTNTFVQYKDFYSRQLRDMIESINTQGEPDVIARTQEAYHVCLNTSYQPKKELYSFRSFVNDSLGQWPLALGPAWKPRWSLEEFLGKVQRLGFSYNFAEFVIIPDFGGASKKIYFLPNPIEKDAARDEPMSTIDKKLGRSKRAAPKPYESFITEIAKKLMGKIVEVNSSEISLLLQMDSEIEQLSLHAEEEDGDSDHEGGSVENEEEEGEDNDEKEKEVGDGEEEDGGGSSSEEVNEEDEDDGGITFKEMNELANSTVDWLRVINAKFENIHNFTEKDKIYLDRHYVKKVSEFLGKYEIRHISNFIIYKAIVNLAPYAGPEIEDLYETFIKTKVSRDMYKHSKRWEHCVTWIQNVYRFSITRLFVKEFIDPLGREKTNEMIELIRESYKKTIEDSSWVDHKTKGRALLKANSMVKHVSYPDFIFDDKALENYYKYIPTVKGTHFSNVVEAKLNKNLKIMKELKEPYNPNEWSFNPLKINAFYMAISNSIWFPVGVLQLPFFDETRPAAVNYAMVGSLIGHEMGHGFDNTGRGFDEKGYKKNWWTPKTLENFVDKATCFVNQYDDYCPEELQGENITKICVDGSRTLGENLADFTGITAAFQGYKHWVKEHGEEKRLPGLENFSSEQIFFISYAYMWCENLPPANWVGRYGNDNHSPASYRVLGTLSNVKEFADSFKCPPGKMNNGEKRCKLW